jgi:Protein of unknown function (DUF2442)
MKSETLGASTSEIEVTQISTQGIWLLLREEEYFLSFQDFPWFKNASISAIQNVSLVSPDHLYWPDLDVDLTVHSIKHPERFPLISNGHRIIVGIGLANLPNEVDDVTLTQALIDDSQFLTYTLAPTPPGVVRCAALDLMLILGATASVASIASLLWTAYEKFIAPKKKEYDDSGIYISISRPDGEIIEFWIGKTHNDRDVFLREFSKIVSDIRATDDPSFWLSEITKIEQNEDWTLRK